MKQISKLQRLARATPAVFGISPLLLVMIGATWLASGPTSATSAVAEPTRETFLGVPTALQQLVLATLPLVAAVAAIVFAWREGWLGDGNLAVAKVAAIVAGMFYLAQELELQSAVQPAPLLPTGSGILGMIAVAINYLAGSVVAYGLWRFVASVIAGGAIGVIWNGRVRAIAVAWRGDRGEQQSEDLFASNRAA